MSATEILITVIACLQIIAGSWFISKRHPELAALRDDPGQGFFVLLFWEFFWLFDILIGRPHPPERHT